MGIEDMPSTPLVRKAIVISSLNTTSCIISSTNFTHTHTHTGIPAQDLVIVRGGLRYVDSWFHGTNGPGAVLVHLNTTPDSAGAAISFSSTLTYARCVKVLQATEQSLRSVFDVDGDGVRDLVMSGPFESTPGLCDRIYSGRVTAGGAYTTVMARFGDLRLSGPPSLPFPSSMNVVASQLQNNGIGSKRFAYEEGINNNQGRGLQGFRRIASE